MTTSYAGLCTPQFAPTPGHYAKYAADRTDYSIDWSDRIPAGDTITAQTWSGDTGLTLSDPSFTDTTTTIWVADGTPGYLYRLVNTITTAAGRVVVRKLLIRVRDL